MEWIILNKEWLFSGIAVAVPIAVLGWFLSRKNYGQNQKGGDGSTNIQIGGNIKIYKDKNDK